MEIPKVFHNKIDKKIENNDKFYYSAQSKKKENLDLINNDTQDVKKELNKIFNSREFIYKANVIIKTTNDTYNTKIIGRNKNQIITMDNKKIDIDDIISINKNNP